VKNDGTNQTRFLPGYPVTVEDSARFLRTSWIALPGALHLGDPRGNGAVQDTARLMTHSMSDSVEANLDVQYSIPLADEVLATFYSTGGRGPVVWA
jgi:hypothetical protein